jgi:hypothetical protein
MVTAKKGRLARWLLDTLNQAYGTSEKTEDVETIARCQDVVGFVLEAANDTEIYDHRTRLRAGASLTTCIKELRSILQVVVHFPDARIVSQM